MSWCVSPRFYPVWNSLHFLDLCGYFLSHLGKFLTIIYSNIFSVPFSFSSSSGTPIIQMFVCLMLSQRSLRLSSILFILFLYSAPQQLFPPFYLPAYLFDLPQLFYYWFLLVYFSFQFFGSSLLSLFWILFQVGCLFNFHLFGLVGFYLAPSSVTYFSCHFIFFVLMGGAVFLSHWLFGLRRPALECAGSWVDPGLDAKMRTSRRPHSD